MTSENLQLETEKFSVVEVTLDGLKRSVVRHPGAVVILPFVNDHQICLIKNQRYAVEEELIELPAGTLEVNEDTAATAIRELREETGYIASSVEKLFEYYVSPGIMNERMYAYVARDLTPGAQSLMEDENITPLVVEFDQAIEWIRSGEIRDAKTICTLLYFANCK